MAETKCNHAFCCPNGVVNNSDILSQTLPWGIRLVAILWSFVAEAKFGLLLSSSYFIYLPIRLNTPDSLVPRTLDRTLRYNNKDCYCCFQPFKFRNYVTFEFQLLILNTLPSSVFVIFEDGEAELGSELSRFRLDDMLQNINRQINVQKYLKNQICEIDFNGSICKLVVCSLHSGRAVINCRNVPKSKRPRIGHMVNTSPWSEEFVKTFPYDFLILYFTKCQPDFRIFG